LDASTAADFEHRSKRSKKLHEKKNAAGKSVLGVKMGTKLHEEKNADGKSLHAAKMLSKRKYSAVADKSKANFKCPNCSRLYFYDTPLDKRGNKHLHQKCGDKAQVVVQYHAMH
jgi:hypothetical protein